MRDEERARQEAAWAQEQRRQRAAVAAWASARGLRESARGGRCLHTLLGRRGLKCPRSGPYRDCSADDYVLLDHARLWLRHGRPAILLAHSYDRLERIQELAAAYVAPYNPRFNINVVIGDPEDDWYGAGTIPIRYERGPS